MSQSSGAETVSAPLKSELPPLTKDTANQPGLTVVYQPKHCKPIVDIIFVHGLGGRSHYTWSYRRDLDLFWPQWLHSEPGLSEARISTYGYDSSVFPAFTKNFSCIDDFSRELLFRIKIAADEDMGQTTFGQVRTHTLCSTLETLWRSLCEPSWSLGLPRDDVSICLIRQLIAIWLT